MCNSNFLFPTRAMNSNIFIGFAILVCMYKFVDCYKAKECHIDEKLKDEIGKYASIVNKIKNLVVDGKLKNDTWSKLANFVDDYGSRLSGTQNLENAIDYMLQKLKEEGLENVHGENVSVPHWVRGEESATLLKPRIVKLAMLGLGGSVGTNDSGITAQAIVVKSFTELNGLPLEKVKGKIVVFNEDYISYGKTVAYRSNGAVEAAKLGAVAVLIRSVTPFSIASPHTGWQDYDEKYIKIPTACITIESAQMLHRLYNRGIELVINIKMEAKMLPMRTSRNTVAEIVGRTNPEKVVLVSGHLDSWDVGQGAMDDGGGAFVSWNSLVVLKTLGLRPRRTIRCVLWTGEEESLLGAAAYLNDHANESKNFNFVMESDEGTFTPSGLSYYGSDDGACILQEILKLMTPFNATELEKDSYPVGSDITLWQLREEVPGGSLKNQFDKYFWYHHSEGDTMAVENSTSLDLCTALWAAVSYIVADISVDIPRVGLK